MHIFGRFGRRRRSLGLSAWMIPGPLCGPDGKGVLDERLRRLEDALFSMVGCDMTGEAPACFLCVKDDRIHDSFFNQVEQQVRPPL